MHANEEHVVVFGVGLLFGVDQDDAIDRLVFQADVDDRSVFGFATRLLRTGKVLQEVEIVVLIDALSHWFDWSRGQPTVNGRGNGMAGGSDERLRGGMKMGVLLQEVLAHDAAIDIFTSTAVMAVDMIDGRSRLLEERRGRGKITMMDVVAYFLGFWRIGHGRLPTIVTSVGCVHGHVRRED